MWAPSGLLAGIGASFPLVSTFSLPPFLLPAPFCCLSRPSLPSFRRSSSPLASTRAPSAPPSATAIVAFRPLSIAAPPDHLHCSPNPISLLCMVVLCVVVLCMLVLCVVVRCMVCCVVIVLHMMVLLCNGGARGVALQLWFGAGWCCVDGAVCDGALLLLQQCCW